MTACTTKRARARRRTDDRRSRRQRQHHPPQRRQGRRCACAESARALDGAPAKIAAALDEYDGTYPDFRTYTRRELEEHIAPYMMWILDRWVDLDGIANDWLAKGRNWMLPDGERAVHVFLTSRPMADIDERDVDLAGVQDDDASCEQD